MNQFSQIKSCIMVWDNRLKRFESEMRKTRDQVEMKQKAYEQSIIDAEEKEKDGEIQLQQLTKDMQSGACLMKDIALFLSQEKKIHQQIAEKKHEIKRHQNARDDAQKVYEISRKDVSTALRKLEKYQLISATLG